MGYHYDDNGNTYFLTPSEEQARGTGPGDTKDQNNPGSGNSGSSGTSGGGYLSNADAQIIGFTRQAESSAAEVAYNYANSHLRAEIDRLLESGRMSRSQAELANDWAKTQATVAANLSMSWMDTEIKRLTANATNRLSVIKMLGDLRGPRNAFQQQAVIHGLNAAGLSRAVDSLMGGATPSFQAAQARPEPVTMETFLEDTGALLPGEIQPIPMPVVPGIQMPSIPGAFTPGGTPAAPAPTSGAPAPYTPGATMPGQGSIASLLQSQLGQKAPYDYTFSGWDQLVSAYNTGQLGSLLDTLDPAVRAKLKDMALAQMPHAAGQYGFSEPMTLAQGLADRAGWQLASDKRNIDPLRRLLSEFPEAGVLVASQPRGRKDWTEYVNLGGL